jgi:hypothetical protein
MSQPISPAATAADASPIGVAFVRTPVAPLNGEPRISSAQVSQRLAGHPVYVLEEREEWLRVRGLDGYEGWLHRGYLMHIPEHGVVVHTPSPEEFALTYVPRISLGARVRGARSGRRSLPLGAWLDLDEEVETGDSIRLDALGGRFPPQPDAIIQSAVTFFEGTRYEWGGITPWGADCSGFVQTVFALHDVRLPRDAWQQALEGVDAGTDLTLVQPADLLFFSERADRRITHVGVALGGMRMAHLALGRGGYAIDRLNDVDDEYVRALVGRFVGARRVA